MRKYVSVVLSTLALMISLATFVFLINLTPTKVDDEHTKQIEMLTDRIKELESAELVTQEVQNIDLSPVLNRIESLEQAQQTITSGVNSMNDAINQNSTQIDAIWATLEENSQVHSNSGELDR